jgi:hypothetical protein|tara:strand:- start:344 stop:556 length:213 start_codon:yes stop_codon:yes gene_type:complete
LKIKIKQHIKDYLRKKQHRRYLEDSVVEMRRKICSQACLIGEVDLTTRNLFLKYNNKLIKWDKDHDKRRN